jgi:hypothetical protein
MDILNQGFRYTNIKEYDKYSLLKFTLSNNGNDEIFSQIRARKGYRILVKLKF